MQRCTHDKRSCRLPVRTDRWASLCPPPGGRSAGSTLTFPKSATGLAAPLFKTFHGDPTVSWEPPSGPALGHLPAGLPSLGMTLPQPSAYTHTMRLAAPSFCLNNSSGEAAPDLGLVPSGLACSGPRSRRGGSVSPLGEGSETTAILSPGPWREAPPCARRGTQPRPARGNKVVWI